ncbi:hypothetical protein [Sphingopyxis sp. MWB1]|uniref:hypothetical protein n=1 Tax=Sphingopyxis sp. MWB1 TaxID=1537715 RepID=UPI00051A0D9F|nr:hypothetical protein [Sphingopyxis sp. MWB1]
MKISHGIRQFHRWLSMAFTLLVIMLFAVQGFGIKPPQWLFLVPLAPLFLLMASGLYLFFQPYAMRRRRAAE